MSVVGPAREIHGRQGKDGIGVTGGITRLFVVTTDNALDDMFTVRTAAGLPQIGEPHPRDPAYVVQSRDYEAAAEPSLSWNVTCEYGRSKNPDQDENPLNEPVKVSWRSRSRDKVLEVDLDGVPVVNSAGTLFADPVLVTRSLVVVTFVRNEPSFYGSYANDWVDHVNSATFSGGAPGTVKCVSIEADKQFKANQEYYEVTYEFWFDPDGWQPRPLNIGYQCVRDGGVKACIDADGRDAKDPQLLAADGTQLALPVSSGSETYRSFTGYPSANFNLLGLPS